MLSDLENPEIRQAAENFYEAVVESLSNVDLLVKRILTQRLEGSSEANLLLLPENAALDLDKQLVENGSEPMLAFYVDGLTSIQTFVIGCSSGISETEAAECSKLISYLTSPVVQQKMLTLGYRASTVGMKITEPSARDIFNPVWGFLVDQEFVISFPPKDQVILAARSLYQSELRTGSLTVMCLDHTGSMADNNNEGINQLRSAMQVILLQDDAHAAKYVLQATESDLVILLPFSIDVLAQYKIEGANAGVYQSNYDMLLRNHSPGGSTNIYGCAIEAIDVVNANSGNDRLPAIILLTDGEHTVLDTSFRDLRNYYERQGNGVPIYSIAIGSVLLKELQEIADLTNGDVCDGRLGEEALAGCFLEFRGNN